MKRRIVSGGAGFIGSHLCDALIEQGDEVLAVDNLFTGRKANVAHLIGNPAFELVRHDVIEPLLIEGDSVYHLACPASPVYYQFNPVKTIKTNVMGTINMLGLAKRLRCSFLLASTSEVYGDPKEHPQQEGYWGHVNPIGPRSCYDEGKRVAESLTTSYQRENGVDAKIVRIFNTYGPRMMFDDGRVVSNFIVQALRGEPITIYGDGSQTRSFCYVDDLVRGLTAMMDADDFHGPVNLGNPEETSILEVAEMIRELTGSRSEVERHPMPEDDPTRRRPDVGLAKRRLGWEPSIDLKTGLERTIEDFASRM